MQLYSYKNEEPKSLPFRIRLEDGTTRTSLEELSSSELESFGFIGPIVKPEYDEETHRMEWNGTEYEIIPLTEEELNERLEEKERRKRAERLNNIDYYGFWNRLIQGKVYKKLRAASLVSLSANTLCTELIMLFNDAKVGRTTTSLIQHYINVLFFVFDFTEEEVNELQNDLDITNLSLKYTLPTEQYLTDNTYDPETNTIMTLKPSPFDSWVLVNGQWQAPVRYPTDGKVYNWDEDLGNWVEVVN